MTLFERLTGRKKLLEFTVTLGNDHEASINVRSSDDVVWPEPVRLWASFHALLVYAQGGKGTERGVEVIAFAAALSQMCKPHMLLVDLVPAVASPKASIAGTLYSFRESDRRIALDRTSLPMDILRLMSIALFQWTFSFTRGNETRTQFLACVAKQLAFLYDDPDAIEQIGGAMRLAQSAADIAFSRATQTEFFKS